MEYYLYIYVSLCEFTFMYAFCVSFTFYVDFVISKEKTGNLLK